MMYKNQEIQVLMWFLFSFYIVFCYHISIFLIISYFPKIDKATMSNWYQYLDDKLVRECIESVFQILDRKLHIDLCCSKMTLFEKTRRGIQT